MEIDKLKLDHIRMAFGLLIIVILSGLALIIGLGHVEESTSHGLMPLITTLSTLGGAFSQWAFRPGKSDE